MNKVYAEGHRGFCALYPENTLLSYQKAIEAGVDAFEFDIWLSKDKVPVLMHDGNALRTCGVDADLREMTLEEIKKLDPCFESKFGSKFKGKVQVPTLYELLDLVKSMKPDFKLGVEIKEYTEETVDIAVKALKEYGVFENCWFYAFNGRIIRYLKEKYNARTMGYPDFQMREFENYDYYDEIGLSMNIVRSELCDFYMAKGLPAHMYCADTPEDVQYCIQKGASLITANDPTALLDILSQQQLKMKQQLMTAPGEIIFREVEVPQVKADQVKIKMMSIGICGSDIHVYHGKHPFTSYPVTQGHEVAGEVVEVGSHVTAFKAGDRVTVEPQIVCGKCYPCRHGKYNLCEELKVMGFQDVGMASEYFVVDEAKVTPIPQEMTYEQGAMIEPLAVAVHGVKQFGDMKGMKVAVLGAGPIGNLVAQTAKGMGAEKVMITDVSDYRLEIAKECGIDVTVNTMKRDFNEAMIEAFGPDKADVIYDCAGNNITMNQAIRHARKGSVIVLVAVFAGMAEVDLAVANDHELDIKSTMMYRHEDYVDAIRLVNEKKVMLEPLISKVFPFAEYKEAYEFIENNREKAMKIIVNVQK